MVGSKAFRLLQHWNGRGQGSQHSLWTVRHLWCSCGLCQFALFADGAQAWPRGWMHQDPFPVSTKNKVSVVFDCFTLNWHPVLSQQQHCAFSVLSRACSRCKNTTSVGFSTAFVSSLIFWTKLLYPQIMMNWSMGLSHLAQRTFRARCAAVDEAWPGLGSMPREQALSLMAVAV